jgi:hypothetical protein
MLPAAATWLALGIYFVTMGGLGWLAWRRKARLIMFAALAGTLTVLASPHSLPHDLLILVAPSWLAVRLYRDGLIGNPIVPLLALELALLIDLRPLSLPLAPVVMALATGWLVWTFRQRRQSQLLGQPVALAG